MSHTLGIRTTNPYNMKTAEGMQISYAGPLSTFPAMIPLAHRHASQELFSPLTTVTFAVAFCAYTRSPSTHIAFHGSPSKISLLAESSYRRTKASSSSSELR